MISVPQVLFKFRDWKNPHHRKILTDNEIYFASPLDFNDPFDSATPPKYIGSDIDSLRNLANQISDKIYSDAELRQMQVLGLEPELQKIADEVWNDMKGNQIGIFSLSENNDNLLLWSHYTDSHQGFCIGFKTEELDSFVMNHRLKKINIERFPVLYPDDNKRPVVIPYHSINGSSNIDSPKLMTVKSNQWQYEKEHRYIAFPRPESPIKVPDYIYHSVIIGCKMNKEDRSMLIDILKAKKRKIGLFEAEMHESEFRLAITPQDY